MSEEKTYYFLNDPSEKTLLKKISIPPPPNYLCINILLNFFQDYFYTQSTKSIMSATASNPAFAHSSSISGFAPETATPP